MNEFFAVSHGGFESTLSDTTGLLSDLTDWTAVVVAPSPARPPSARPSWWTWPRAR